jgi:hypothetical protein
MTYLIRIERTPEGYPVMCIYSNGDEMHMTLLHSHILNEATDCIVLEGEDFSIYHIGGDRIVARINP